MLLRSILFQLAAWLNFLVQATLFLPLLFAKEDHVWPFARFQVRSTLIHPWRVLAAALSRRRSVLAV